MTTASPERSTSVAPIPDLQDRLDITDLVYRLGVCLDEHRTEDLQPLFTEDVTAVTPGGTASGKIAVIDQATRNHAADQRFQHQISNVLIELDGDRAAVRVNLVAVFVQDSAVPVFLLGAVYRFGTRRTSQGWRIDALQVDPVWRFAPPA